jgi:protein tyrosine/serine phosphatase
MLSAIPQHGAPRRPRALLVTIVIAVVAALGGAWFYRYAVRDNLFPKNFGVVEEGKVYRSGGLTPGALASVVRKHGIRTIVDLGAWEAGSEGDRREQRSAEALGIERYRFELVGDGTGNPNHYVSTLRLLTDPAKQPVLVHCGAGAERTGVAVILYRRVTRGTPIEEAYEEAKQYRHRPERNPQLRRVLDRYAQLILDAFRGGGQILIPGEVDAVPEPVPIAPAGPDAR